MALVMLSLLMLLLRAISTALRNRGLPLMSPPPILAATVISLSTLVAILPFLASAAPFLCLIVDQRECPLMVPTPDPDAPASWGAESYLAPGRATSGHWS